MKIKCEVYRCGKKADTYLYVKDGVDLEDLPDELLDLLGELTPFLKLELSESSKLARVETDDVLLALADQGYYLQLPPGEVLKSQVPGSGFVQ
jgi:uncharacterized protein YcgL (UPF0745 family)